MADKYIKKINKKLTASIEKRFVKESKALIKMSKITGVTTTRGIVKTIITNNNKTCKN